MTSTAESPETTGTRRRQRLTGPAVLVGMGLGGFADGIVLHQILQWHHLLSSTERYGAMTMANLETNMLADGLFHAATWLLVVGGLVWGWRRMRAGGRMGNGLHALGGLAVGWGIFNLVEGTVDHHVLGIHHVRPGPGQLVYDLAFLAMGAVLLVGGVLLLRVERPGPSTSRRRPGPDIDIARGEGRTPAMNRPGRKAADDRAVIPGNLGWDEPSSEAGETLEGAVRRADHEQSGEPGAPPGRPRRH
jgi:uncharacterized membrane protein